jgi:ketosteroid isomerase-like protein
MRESRDGSIHRRTVMTSATALVGAAYAATARATPARNSSLADTVVRHLQAIQSRDLPGLESTLTSGEQLDLFLPSGVHLATRQAYLELHREWFADPDWSWSCTPVTQVISDDLAVVTVRSRSETARDDQPPVEVSETWVTLTFRRETGRWALVHDQNTRIASD